MVFLKEIVESNQPNMSIKIVASKGSRICFWNLNMQLEHDSSSDQLTGLPLEDHDMTEWNRYRCRGF